MPSPKIVEQAAKAPGVCAISGEAKGPFVDVGKPLEKFRRGRIYLSLRYLSMLLEHDLGWLSADRAAEVRKERDEALAQMEELSGFKDRYLAIVEAVQDLIEPRVEVDVEVRRVPREPTDEEIALFMLRHPDHPLLRDHHRRPGKGSYEESKMVYGDHLHGPATRRLQQQKEHVRQQAVLREAEAVRVALQGELEAAAANAETLTVEVHGQHVDLGDLIDTNPVKDVVEWLRGHERSLLEQALTWERHHRNRTTLVEKLDGLIAAFDDPEAADQPDAVNLGEIDPLARYRDQPDDEDA